MAYIGFLIIMLGLAAAGGAIDRGDSLLGAIAMTAAGAWLMWLFREEDKDSEKEDYGSDHGGGSVVDKPAGEGAGGCREDQTGGGGTGDQDVDHGVLSWNGHRDGKPYQTGNLRGTQGVGRENGAGVEMRRR